MLLKLVLVGVALLIAIPLCVIAMSVMIGGMFLLLRVLAAVLDAMVKITVRALHGIGVSVDWDRFSQSVMFVLAWAVVLFALWLIYAMASRAAAVSIACVIAIGILLAEKRDRKRRRLSAAERWDRDRWCLFVERYYLYGSRGIADNEWHMLREAPTTEKLTIQFAFDSSRPWDGTTCNVPKPQTDPQWAKLSKEVGISVCDLKALCAKATHHPQVIPYRGGTDNGEQHHQ